MTEASRPYARRLANLYVWGLIGGVAAWPLLFLPPILPFLVPLAPMPAIVKATLLVRDFGWQRGLAGAPAVVFAVAFHGVATIALAVIEDGGSL